MGKRKIINNIEAYPGMYVDYKRKVYQLVKTESSKKYCRGCALYDVICPERITSLCTQGYILKKVEI